jgi:hypothetical protein
LIVSVVRILKTGLMDIKLVFRRCDLIRHGFVALPVSLEMGKGDEMVLGTLLAASAFEVSPQQQTNFEGGDVANLAELQKGLVEAAEKGNIDQGLAVTLKVVQNRFSPVRDAVMRSAFGSLGERLEAAKGLAVRLAMAMDGRSSTCLLVASVHELRDASRQVVMWTFPRERVIHRAGRQVDVDDAFSLNSRLRKAAMMSGHENRDGFLTARVLDQQTTGRDRVAADFWIIKFLNGVQQIGMAEGTKLAAATFRNTYSKLSPPDQEILQSAMASVRILTDRQWSLEAIGTELMPEGNAQMQFLKAAGKREDAIATFTIDTQEFDRLVGLRVFTLANGVRVSAPASVIDGDVIIEESEAGRTLHLKGIIMGEKLSKRA